MMGTFFCCDKMVKISLMGIPVFNNVLRCVANRKDVCSRKYVRYIGMRLYTFSCVCILTFCLFKCHRNERVIINIVPMSNTFPNISIIMIEIVTVVEASELFRSEEHTPELQSRGQLV